MHHISRIHIQNFKSIKDAVFQLSAYTPLVGYNNAGKTNVLQALSWVIKKSSLPATDFHDPNSPVIVTADISGIDADVLDALEVNHRSRIEPLIVGGAIKLRRTQVRPDTGVAAIQLEIQQFQDGQAQWVVNPAGIDAAISRLFPDPIWIGAMENAAEDVGKFASGTTIGKLIKEIIGPVAERHAGPVTEALAQVARRLSADSGDKDETLVELDRKIQQELTRFFPGVTAKTHIQTPEFSDFLKNSTIKIYDQHFDPGSGRDASSFGHGAQRSVQIALIKCLSDIKKSVGATEARTTILLIDEPELYLHPQAIEIVRSSLRRLAREGYQVVFSTHSANMIAREDAPNALLIRRSVQHGTTCLPRIVDAAMQALDNAAHQSEVLFALSNSTKVLFSEKVVLAEGKTEQTILPDLLQHQVGHSLEEERLGLVSLGGGSDVPNALKVLSAIGIPTKAVVDLDFAFRPAVQYGLIPENAPALLACKVIFARLKGENKIDIGEDGLPRKSGQVNAAMAFEMMANEPDAGPHIDILHDLLKIKNIWLWKKGAIEAHLGLTAKTHAAHASFLASLPNEQFRAGLPAYADVQRMIEWLRG